MSPQEIITGIKRTRQDLEIQVYTMDFLEKKENKKFIIEKALKKLIKSNNGDKTYHFVLKNDTALKKFKTTINRHFEYIIKDCDKPDEPTFNDYKGEIDINEAYCDFYDYAIKVTNKKLKNQKLIKENLNYYFNKIQSYIHCSKSN